MRRLTWGEIAAVVTAGVVAIVYVARGGELFSPGALNASSKAGVPQGGVQSHAQLGGNCGACHAPPWSKATMADRCLACHTDVQAQLAAGGPLHGLLAAGRECRTCHTEHQGATGALTSFAHFDHDCTAFKLTGAHRAVDCKACHAGSTYKGASQACSACHAEPAVHLGRFGTGCGLCHSTTNWTTVAGAGTGLANFDHASTGFKLTGAHQSIDCKACHAGSGFKGLSSSCVSCHAEPLVPVIHKVRYGVGCTGCHSTSTFRGAKFTHAVFAVNHGKKDNTCATCHQDQSNFTVYTCYNCHHHTPEKEARRHARRNVAKLDNCIDCHARNRPRRVAELDGGTLPTGRAASFPHGEPLRKGDLTIASLLQPPDFACGPCRMNRLPIDVLTPVQGTSEFRGVDQRAAGMASKYVKLHASPDDWLRNHAVQAFSSQEGPRQRADWGRALPSWPLD